MDITSGFFTELDLSKEVTDALAAERFLHPSPIQKQAIPILAKGKDLIGCAQTGTGKTLAFVVPILERLKHTRGTKALILCPTREIAQQTHRVLTQLGPSLNVSCELLIGGQSVGKQTRGLGKTPTVLVATPGRLLDHWERKNVNLAKIEYAVLDEADHMLDLGFIPQVRRIFKGLPKKRQTLMFSATFPREIEQLAHQFLNNPKRITIAPPGTVAEGVKHVLFLVDVPHKREAILTLLKDVNESTLVFTRTKLDAEWLQRLLKKRGQKVHALHSDRTQKDRTKYLESFRQGEFPIMVATDVLARGIDIVDIAHVVNYDIPQNPDDYIHRVGRTARAKKKGHASTIATWMERHFIEAIEKKLGRKIPRGELTGIPPYPETSAPKTSLGRQGRRGKRVRLR